MRHEMHFGRFGVHRHGEERQAQDPPRVFADGKFVGYGLEVGDSWYVDAKPIAKQLGFGITFDDRQKALIYTSPDYQGDPAVSEFPASGHSKYDVVNGARLLRFPYDPILGRRWPDVDLQSPKVFSACGHIVFSVDSENRAIGFWQKSSEEAGLPRGVPIDVTGAMRCVVLGTGGDIKFKDASLSGGTFTAEIICPKGHFLKTAKPIQLDLSVTLFDENGKVLSRDTTSVYGAAWGGGTYPMSVYTSTDDAKYVDVRLTAAWVPKR